MCKHENVSVSVSMYKDYVNSLYLWISSGCLETNKRKKEETHTSFQRIATIFAIVSDWLYAPNLRASNQCFFSSFLCAHTMKISGTNHFTHTKLLYIRAVCIAFERMCFFSIPHQSAGAITCIWLTLISIHKCKNFKRITK